MKPAMWLRVFLAVAFSVSSCQPVSVFLDPDQVNGTLIQTQRYNSGWFEELQTGDLKRECIEERCSYEEAREVFEHPETTDEFWETYNDTTVTEVGATPTNETSLQKICSCDKTKNTSCVPAACVTSHGCRYRNGGCEHFCREFPDRSFVCFCATGYKLHTDNSTCLPQDTVPCGRPQVHFAPRVVNGQICPKGHCPWQALLSENNVYICGAIVLSDQWILTAAHCVWQKPATVFHVVVGEHDREEEEKTEQRRRVLEVVIHPGYNESSYDSDLAIMKLHRPVKLGLHVVPICLPAKNSTFLRTLATVRHSTVSGWGRLRQMGPPARFLQRLVLPRVPLHECQLYTSITRNMFCAGYKTGGRDSCEGDGGGPLVTRYKKTWFLMGVVSWGNGCGNENQYGVYTKVSNFLGWIDDFMYTH